MASEMKNVMVTGANGQIGSELVAALRKKHGAAHVLATDIAEPGPAVRDGGPFEFLDVTRREQIGSAVQKYGIDTVYHLAAILSATFSSARREASAMPRNRRGLPGSSRRRGTRVDRSGSTSSSSFPPPFGT